MNGLDEILAGYPALQAGQEAFYKDLHAHPELSHQEHRTAQCVAGQLQKYGFTVQAGIGGTGVVGVLANGTGPTVLLRAERDALPIREDTGVDYASTVTTKGADGSEVPVAHACGHDMHMSCLLGAGKLMAGHPAQWNGTLIALFQPAEETAEPTRQRMLAAIQRIVRAECQATGSPKDRDFETLLTHLHADHTGDLAGMILYPWGIRPSPQGASGAA